MKRKRGHKKSKSKTNTASLTEPVGENPVIVDTVMSDNYTDDDVDNSNTDKENGHESGMEVDKVDRPSSVGTDPPLVSVVSNKPVEKPIVVKSYSRVKVRLKTSKVLESDILSQSENTDNKSGSLVGSEKLQSNNVVGEKMEDCANSLAELKQGDSGSSGTKVGSIKIKSASSLKVLTVSSSDNKSTNGGLPEGSGIILQKEPRTVVRPEYRYSKQELDASLTVIKKIMKMDAAEPFNVPVNPVALGIPDYFDVIKTPMDFGTVCSNIERGDKYKNSEDVFKDVQYIWDNCYKYNNKGDYILDLMRRVKKNFMKYWAAAGMFIFLMQDAETESGQGKIHLKGDPLKPKKRGRRHKSDCMCAVCILKRKKKEREAQEAQMARGVDYQGQELKPEVSTAIGSPDGEDSSSNTDDSLDEDADADADVQGKGEHMKGSGSEQQYNNPIELKFERGEERKEEGENEARVHNGNGETNEPFEDRLEHEANRQSQLAKLDAVGQANGQNDQNSRLPDEETVLVQQQKQKESEARLLRAQLLETFQFQNPNLLSLCGILFPENRKSVWSGPHSLVKHKGRPSRTSLIHKAVEKILS
ncbi:hypothetical protein ACFE04_023024 [Oxalis oulophora]